QLSFHQLGNGNKSIALPGKFAVAPGPVELGGQPRHIGTIKANNERGVVFMGRADHTISVKAKMSMNNIGLYFFNRFIIKRQAPVQVKTKGVDASGNSVSGFFINLQSIGKR